MGLHNSGELDFLEWLDSQLTDKDVLQETTMIELQVSGRFPLATLKTAAQYHQNHTVLIGTEESYDLNLDYDDIPDAINANSVYYVSISVSNSYTDCQQQYPEEDPSFWDWNGGMNGFLFTCREQFSRYR